MRDYAGCLPVLLDVDLLHAGWDGSVEPYPGISPRAFAIQSLRNSLLKKFEDEKNDDADSKALALFLKVNAACRDYHLDTSSMSEPEAIALGEAKSFIDSFFNDGEFYLPHIEQCFGLGNGANIGAYETSFFSKLATSRLSATSQALFSLYEQAISADPIWSGVESTRKRNRKSEIVRGSRLSFVPKTRNISRTICTEPILNMLYQKGLAALIEARLERRVGISLKTQPDKNRELARLGSNDGRFGTIDLSSASDSMSLTMVSQMFPKRIVDLLGLMRSPLTILPDGSEVELHMVSSMGNAFTFPLQTLLFTSVVYGVYRVYGIDFNRPFRQNLGNFAVYGDDIIVDRKAYGLVVRMLSLLGFAVNVDKSFNTGTFRESCGRDFHLGYNVRGVYIKSLRTVYDVYSAINRLNRWSANWEIPLPRTIEYLIKGHRLNPIPYDEMDDGGVKIPFRDLRKVVRNKFTRGVLYRVYIPRSTRLSLADVESQPPRALRGYFHNHDGVLLAALAGTLRDASITVKLNGGKRHLKVRYSSSWDFIAPNRYHIGSGFGERWKSFVELNLNLI
jgi:hypothetical protein